MNEWTPSLLAQSNLAESWGSRFRGSHAQLDSSDILMVLLILTGAALAIWLLSRVPAVQARVRRSNSPRALFGQLCRAHELDRANRRLLRQLARYHRMKHPASLFLEPKRFNGRFTGRLKHQRAKIHYLRGRLFSQAPSLALPIEAAIPDREPQATAAQ